MANLPHISDDDVIDSIKNWINKVIVGLNFCPFAKKEMERDTVHYCVSDDHHIDQALQLLLDQFVVLDEHPQYQTGLIIFKLGFKEFDQYLDLVEYANGLIEQGGYAGIYQLATFHPDYCFEGEHQDDPANYTNRSPYPILHILREVSLEAVLKRYPNPESIPENNINKAREIGAQALHDLIFVKDGAISIGITAQSNKTKP